MSRAAASPPHVVMSESGRVISHQLVSPISRLGWVADAGSNWRTSTRRASTPQSTHAGSIRPSVTSRACEWSARPGVTSRLLLRGELTLSCWSCYEEPPSGPLSGRTARWHSRCFNAVATRGAPSTSRAPSGCHGGMRGRRSAKGGLQAARSARHRRLTSSCLHPTARTNPPRAPCQIPFPARGQC